MKIKKIVFRYRPVYFWCAVFILILWTVANLSFTIAYAARAPFAYYNGVVIPKIIIEKQEIMLQLQASYIEELKSENNTLKIALTLQTEAYDNLRLDIVQSLTPFFKSIGSNIVIENGKIYIDSPRGRRALR